MRRIAPVLVVVWGCGGQDTAPPPEWKPGASIPGGPRQETAVVADDGRYFPSPEVYVIGGFDGTRNIVATVEAYDPYTNQWRARASLPVPAHHVNAAAVGGKIYVVGLLQGNGFTAAGLAYAYDPINDEWTERASMPVGSERGASGVAVIGDKIYVGGGLRGGAAVADLSAYDTKNDTWESLSALPEPRDHLVAAAPVAPVADSRVFFIGGRQGGIGTHSPKVFIYDPTANSWSEGAPMPTSRAGMAAAVIDRFVIVAGGEGNAAAASGVFPQVELRPVRECLGCVAPDAHAAARDWRRGGGECVRRAGRGDPRRFWRGGDGRIDCALLRDRLAAPDGEKQGTGNRKPEIRNAGGCAGRLRGKDQRELSR